MRIIDNNDRLKERFVNLPEGNVFRYNNQYYMKTRAMFFYSEVDDLIDEDNIYDIDQIEAHCQIVNAICLNDYASYCHFEDDRLIEPLKAELHIVV